MGPYRHLQWTTRLNRLHAAVARHSHARRWEASRKAQAVLRETYDAWAREIGTPKRVMSARASAFLSELKSRRSHPSEDAFDVGYAERLDWSAEQKARFNGYASAAEQLACEPWGRIMWVRFDKVTGEPLVTPWVPQPIVRSL